MLLGDPTPVNFGSGGVCSCNGVMRSFAFPLGWRQQCQGTFVPRDGPWGHFTPVPENRHQPSRQTGTSLPGSLLKAVESCWAGAWKGLGAAGTGRAGDASPSVGVSGVEGREGSGGIPGALTLSEGFPWVLDVKTSAPCMGSHPCGPPAASGPRFALSWPHAMLCSMKP